MAAHMASRPAIDFVASSFAGDNVINVGRITTSVYHCKCGMRGAASFTALDSLLYVNDEQSGRKTRQVGNRAEFFSPASRAPAGDLSFSRGERCNRTMPSVVILSMVAIFLTASYGGEVCRACRLPERSVT